jgi:hypothetical protein
MNIEIRKRRYYELWLEWPKKAIELRRRLTFTDGTRAIDYANGLYMGVGYTRD